MAVATNAIGMTTEPMHMRMANAVLASSTSVIFVIVGGPGRANLPRSAPRAARTWLPSVSRRRRERGSKLSIGGSGK